MSEIIVAIVYIVIGCMLVYYLWKDMGYENENKKAIAFYAIVFIFWPFLILISLLYAIILYLEDMFGPHGGCAA